MDTAGFGSMIRALSMLMLGGSVEGLISSGVIFVNVYLNVVIKLLLV